jgi:DNA-binding transcriptional MerR regulator
MDTGEWTIEELAERVADALGAGYPGQPSGRVREVPDRRTIRWYTTIGLVDRPAAMRGRTALYGRRHLLQLVAVKRLQAQGRSLADVQRELLGAGDTDLERIARLPETPARTAAAQDGVSARHSVRARRGIAQTRDVARARFWAAPPAVPAASPAHDQASAAADADPAVGVNITDADRAHTETARADAPHTDAAGTDADALVPAIRLDGGATLVLDAAGRAPTASELAAIRTAAGPLLDLLHRLDLTKGTP